MVGQLVVPQTHGPRRPTWCKGFYATARIVSDLPTSRACRQYMHPILPYVDHVIRDVMLCVVGKRDPHTHARDHDALCCFTF